MIRYLFFSLFFTLFVVRSNAQDAEPTAKNVTDLVDAEATYPGGMKALYQHISNNVRIPDTGLVNDTILKVRVKILIDRDGCISDMKVITDPGYGLGEEAIRVLSLAKKWSPAIDKGKPVMALFVVPFQFHISGTGLKEGVEIKKEK
jgi:periplasmic protein TonB